MRISDWSSDVCSSDLYHTGRRIFIFTLRPVHLKIVSGRSLDRLGVSGSIQREAMSSAGCRFGNIGRWRAAETAPALGCVYAAALAASRIRKAPITASAALIQTGMTSSVTIRKEALVQPTSSASPRHGGDGIGHKRPTDEATGNRRGAGEGKKR